MLSKSDSSLSTIKEKIQQLEKNCNNAATKQTTQTSHQSEHGEGKGDAGLSGTAKCELTMARDMSRTSSVRKQRSSPTLSILVQRPNQGKVQKPVQKRVTLADPPKKFDVPEIKCTPSLESIESGPICESLQKDPKLKALCNSIGIGQSPDTLVGPIEKGQLIIGTLQESLTDLIKMKIKKADKIGKRFHIQQSGLDMVARALENAERSLKTIKESKEPALGRARQQQSLESLPQINHKTTEAVIRILNTVKDKFDKMDNGVNQWMRNIYLVSSTVSTPSSAISFGSRRPTGLSIRTPATPFNTAVSSRARTSGSSTSIGSRNGRKKLISTM